MTEQIIKDALQATTDVLLPEIKRLKTELAEEALLNAKGAEREADLKGKVMRLKAELTTYRKAPEAEPVMPKSICKRCEDQDDKDRTLLSACRTDAMEASK